MKKGSMDTVQIIEAIGLGAITLAAGLADAQGFIHASNVWDGGKFIWQEAILSASGFGSGILLYWVCIRFLQHFKIISPEIQTLGWFAATIVGVAFFDGKFFHWQIIDQIIGIVVISGVAWLMFRGGA
jgi:hypothetical protein